MIEIKGNVGPKGTVSFDGRVLEYFGFGKEDSRRIHINQITDVEAGRRGNQLVMVIHYDIGSRNVFFDPIEEEKVKEMVNQLRERINSL